MESNKNNLNLAGLSISENSPNLTSRTPPPPGFDGAHHSTNSEKEKSSSYNNLARALGTGLAESMENSTSDGLVSIQHQQGLQQPRMPTPSNVDNYIRQSRHLASRLVGGGNDGVAGGMTHNNMGGGFDYLNPAGTGHVLIPPSNNAFLEKLKAERENKNGLGKPSQGGGDFLSSLSGASSTRAQQQGGSEAFIAAMNAQAQSITTNNSETNNQSGLNENQELLSQKLLRHQMWQQGNTGDNYKANVRPIGVTVVEPSSRNSPAPRAITANNVNAVVHPNNSSNGVAGNQNFVQSINFAGGRLSAPPPSTEGRASAPPINSQRVGGGLNIGLGGANNNATLRAMQASSLQMRVAELHQQLGTNGNSNGMRVRGNVPVNLRTMPGGNVIVLASPAPPPSQILMKPPSREATPLDRNSPRPQMMSVNNSAASGNAQHQISRLTPEQKEKERTAVEELAPFLRDPPKNQKYQSNAASNASSRGVAILYASHLVVADVKSTCEAFGGLDAFRSDFAEPKGVYFVTFYDLRSARLAISELPKALNTSGNDQVEVKYCVPLNSSSNTDESMILLSNVPGNIDEQDINQCMSSYGEIRNVHYQASMSDDESDRVTYLVEFYDIQDARQALQELEHSTPWGTDVSVKVGSRNPTKRKQGKELLVFMSSWRQGQIAEAESSMVSPSPSPHPPQTSTPNHSNTSANKNYGAAGAQSNYQYQTQDYQQQQYSTQLMIGPDGNYMYVLVPNQPGVAPQAYGFPGQMLIDPHAQQQQYMYGNQQYLQSAQQFQIDQQYQMQYNQMNNMQASNYSIHAQDKIAPPQFVRLPSDMNTYNSGSLSSGSVPQSPVRQMAALQNRMTDIKSTTSHGSGSSSGNRPREEENNSSSLNIEAVRSGRDSRSSLMVRNIPNKYTQKMMLAEFAASGHGSDKVS